MCKTTARNLCNIKYFCIKFRTSTIFSTTILVLSEALKIPYCTRCFSCYKWGTWQCYRDYYYKAQGHHIDTTYSYVPEDLRVVLLYVTTGLKCNVHIRSSVDHDSTALPFCVRSIRAAVPFCNGRSTGVLPGEVYVQYRSPLFRRRICSALTFVLRNVLCHVCRKQVRNYKWRVKILECSLISRN
jgi:hypothetical protein